MIVKIVESFDFYLVSTLEYEQWVSYHDRSTVAEIEMLIFVNAYCCSFLEVKTKYFSLEFTVRIDHSADSFNPLSILEFSFERITWGADLLSKPMMPVIQPVSFVVTSILVLGSTFAISLITVEIPGIGFTISILDGSLAMTSVGLPVAIIEAWWNVSNSHFVVNSS